MSDTKEGAPYPPATPTPATLDIAALGVSLRSCPLGRPIVYEPAMESTNTHASELAREGYPDGALIITDHQTAGRGRIGRAWVALPGQQLTFSLILRPTFSAYWLVMASALAVAEAVEDVTGLRPAIKWPNDILLTGRKLCGILIETSGGVAVLGIGVNVNGSFEDAPTMATRAITLEQATGHIVSREVLATEIVHSLAAYYVSLLTTGEEAQAQVRNAWRDRLETLGQPTTVRQGVSALHGVAEDVDSDGSLLLRAPDGALHRIHWGDVE